MILRQWSGPLREQQTLDCGPSRSRRIAAALMGLTCGVLAISPQLSCRQTEPEYSLPDPLTSSELQGDAKLQQALNFLNRLDEFDQATAQAEILKNLQEWISQQQLDPAWTPDPLSQRLPKTYLPMVTRDRLGQTQLEPYDAIALQEATWMRDVARSIDQQNEPSPQVAALLTQIGDDVAAEYARDLSRAVRLFDWTVRNLQLDEDVLAGERGRLNSDVLLFAWESLLFGRGTLNEKSRVFLLLCRQAGLPVVVLAIEPATESGDEPTTWLPAVLLGDQLYLFDMRLGVPVPGPDGRGVATLAQVLDSPELLDPLSLPDEAYPIARDDLARVVALIDATPPELSHRMQRLERALVGQQKLVLTISPTRIKTALADCEGIERVGLWTMPYDSFILRGRLQENQLGLVSLAHEHSLFDRRTPLAPARILHLRGQYDNHEDDVGARALYLDCRASEQQIRSVAELPLRTSEGEQQAPPTAEQQAAHQRQLASIQAMMHRTKENASYWLGLMAYDRGEYGVSIDWLEVRLLQISPETVWKAGAIYNLGRAYEARGRADGQIADLKRALELYSSSTLSPNHAACQWRAQQLAKEVNDEPQSLPNH
jgi:hypothetical protein